MALALLETDWLMVYVRSRGIGSQAVMEPVPTGEVGERWNQVVSGY